MARARGVEDTHPDMAGAVGERRVVEQQVGLPVGESIAGALLQPSVSRANASDEPSLRPPSPPPTGGPSMPRR